MKLGLLISAFALVGCQTLAPQPLQDSANLVSAAREPAAAQPLSCFALFSPITHLQTVTTPSPERVREDLDKLASYGLGPNSQRDLVTQQYYRSAATDFGSVDLSRLLYSREQNGDRTGKIYRALGFRVVGGNKLFPPEDLAVFYSNMYRAIQTSAHQAGISDDDILWPAALFMHGEQKQFTRIGIDPLPPSHEGWEMVGGDMTLDAEDYARMILERRMIFSPGMLFHDVGHEADLIERPRYMISFRKYVEARAEFQHDLKSLSEDEKTKRYGSIVHRDVMEIYLNEWLFFPDFGNRASVMKVVDAPEGSLGQALEKASSYVENREHIFVRHGGGARDWSLERFTTNRLMRKGLLSLANGKADERESLTRPADLNDAYWIDEPPQMLARLDGLLDYFRPTTGDSEKMKPRIHKLIDEISEKRGLDPRFFAESLLRRQLTQLNSFVTNAYRYQMTPERLTDDLALLYQPGGFANYRKSPSYKFYSTFPADSFHQIYLVEVGRK